MTPLPRLLVVTDRRLAAAAGHDLVDVVMAAVAAGARAVLLREKDLPEPERWEIAHQLADCLGMVGGQLLVATGPSVDEPSLALLSEVGACGLHLAASPEGGTPGLDRLILGQSCHSVAELRAAADRGLSYATLSPIWETPSKPGYGPALGPSGLAAAVDAVPELPVFALGGVTAERAASCVAAGAAGVAVMGAVMGAADPGAEVRGIRAALGETGR